MWGRNGRKGGEDGASARDRRSIGAADLEYWDTLEKAELDAVMVTDER